jgi:mannosyl-oligosaccharide alpha-1,2-mannosidase
MKKDRKKAIVALVLFILLSVTAALQFQLYGAHLLVGFPTFKYRGNSSAIFTANKVKSMTRKAWSSFYKYARDSDELKPLSKKGYNWTRETMHYTAVDSLDTLYIMGLETEYQQAKDIVLSMRFDKIDYQISHFETTIRSLGGLLAAYELDGDHRFIEVAVDLADRLLRAFDTPTGIPYSHIDLKDGSKRGGLVSVASAGTLQLEFQYLSDITGNPIYQDTALYVYEQLHWMEKEKEGLFPTYLNISKLEFFDHIQFGIGPENDSFYEYLLKIYLSTGHEKFRRWYQMAADV